ncbi:MAG: DUF1501 domain-containing protein [Planctomycetes bacterium]|nr:DUF1501 domain-containing protein [Planctomycetota bacterium]
MSLSRRNFLKAAALGTGVMLLPGALLRMQEAAKTRRNAVVLVYLRGGADALNVLVPFATPRYYDIRPTLAIPVESKEGAPGVVKLDERFGLHPSLSALKAWYDKGRFAPLVNTGSPHTTRSHFDAQDFMEYAAPGNRSVRTGWLNRYLVGSAAGTEAEGTLRALAMQGLLPRALRGDYAVLAVPDEKVLREKELLEVFEDHYGEKKESGKKEEPTKDEPKKEEGKMEGERPDDAVEQTGRDTVRTLKRYQEILAKPVAGKRAAFPDSQFGRKMRDIATVVRADVGLEVACLDYNGWDDHVNEGGNEGQMANRLKDLGDSMSAFAEDLGDALDRTLVLVVTEFGRTCRENGNEGTDHGHGGFAFLLGGKAQGGKVHGEWTGLDDAALYQKRDLPVTTDFRDLFAEVLKGHLAFEAPAGFFPEYTHKGVKGLFKA